MIDEQRAPVPVALESVDLAAGPVEREHQLRARALAQRLVADAPLELGEQFLMPAQGERAVDAPLGDLPALLVEAGSVDLRCALELRARQGIASPEPERLLIRAKRFCVIAGARSRARGHCVVTEQTRVELVVVAA